MQNLPNRFYEIITVFAALWCKNKLYIYIYIYIYSDSLNRQFYLKTNSMTQTFAVGNSWRQSANTTILSHQYSKAVYTTLLN